MLQPFFKNNSIPIVFSTDNNYAKYLIVTLKSLICNISNEYNYEIYILDDNVSDRYKKKTHSFEKKNVKISFIDIKPYLKNIDLSIFHLKSHFALPTYYRFFIPEIFKNFKKLLYLDCDIIILGDVAKLYNIDLKNNFIGAIKDIAMQDFLERKLNVKYFDNILKLQNKYNYFQAGVLILDVQKLLNFKFEEKCLKTLCEIKTPLFVDQCILNKVLENHVEFINQEWNIQWQMPYFSKGYENRVKKDILKEYQNGLNNPKIIHYASFKKPWIQYFYKNANYFWKYAIISPTNFEIIKNLFCIKKIIKDLTILIKIYN